MDLLHKSIYGSKENKNNKTDKCDKADRKKNKDYHIKDDLSHTFCNMTKKINLNLLL